MMHKLLLVLTLTVVMAEKPTPTIKDLVEQLANLMGEEIAAKQKQQQVLISLAKLIPCGDSTTPAMSDFTFGGPEPIQVPRDTIPLRIPFNFKLGRASSSGPLFISRGSFKALRANITYNGGDQMDPGLYIGELKSASAGSRLKITIRDIYEYVGPHHSHFEFTDKFNFTAVMLSSQDNQKLTIKGNTVPPVTMNDDGVQVILKIETLGTNRQHIYVGLLY